MEDTGEASKQPIWPSFDVLRGVEVRSVFPINREEVSATRGPSDMTSRATCLCTRTSSPETARIAPRPSRTAVAGRSRQQWESPGATGQASWIKLFFRTPGATSMLSPASLARRTRQVACKSHSSTGPSGQRCDLAEPCLGHLLQSAHDIGTSALKHICFVATRARQNMVVSEEV